MEREGLARVSTYAEIVSTRRTRLQKTTKDSRSKDGLIHGPV